MARNPARQLNSKSIRDAILSYIVPSVEKKFCIVSGKCTWRVTGNEELAEAWKLISQKRHQCDAALSKLTNVGFYFSAIASCEPKAKSGKKKASEEDEEEAVVTALTKSVRAFLYRYSCGKKASTSNFVLDSLRVNLWFSSKCRAAEEGLV